MILNIMSSDKTKFYQVKKYDTGQWTCTCPHFIFRLKGKSACKHIDEAKRLSKMNLEEVFNDIDWSEPVPEYKLPG